MKFSVSRPDRYRQIRPADLGDRRRFVVWAIELYAPRLCASNAVRPTRMRPFRPAYAADAPASVLQNAQP